MNSRLLSRWRVLTEPVMIAGQVTWLAVFLMVVRAPTSSLLPLSDAHQRQLLIGGLLLFLGLLIGCAIRQRSAISPLRLLAAGTQILVALLVTAASGTSMGPVLLIIVMASLTSLLSRTQLTLTFVLSNAAVLAILVQRWGWQDAAMAALSFGGFQLFAIMMAVYARRAELVSAELQQVNAHLLATRSLLAESARDQERLRISRELHDIAGHKLTAMTLHLRALALHPQVRGLPEVDTCAQLAAELLGDIREVVRQMRAHDGMSLRSAIEQVAQAMPKPHAHIEVAATAAVGNALQAEALLRAVQEAITNAARHGAAENIWISLHRVDDRIELDVRDDGCGSGKLTFGSGLSGMRERIEALGGALQPSSSAGGGFSLHAWIPAT